MYHMYVYRSIYISRISFSQKILLYFVCVAQYVDKYLSVCVYWIRVYCTVLMK